jgi:hypothetical protein
MSRFEAFAELYLQGCDVKKAWERSATRLSWRLGAARSRIFWSLRSVLPVECLGDRPEPKCLQAHLPTDRRATRAELRAAWEACTGEKVG